LGFNRFLNAKELEQDIINNYQDAIEDLDYLHEQCRTQFDLSKNLDVLMKRIKTLPEMDIIQFRKRNSLAKRTYGAYMDAFNEIERLKREQANLPRRIRRYLLRSVKKHIN
jgi:RNAse (barnase) inhibitor barstar